MKNIPTIVYEYVTDYAANNMIHSKRNHYAVKGTNVYRIVMIQKMTEPKIKKGWSPLTHKCTAILIETDTDYPNDNNKFCFTEFPNHKRQQLDSINISIIDSIGE